MRFSTNCFLFALSLLVFSCKDKPKNVIKADVAHVELKLPATRLDQQLFANAGSVAQLRQWSNKELANDPFYKIYLEQIMQIKADSSAVKDLYAFASFPEFKVLQKDIDSLYGNINPQHKQLEEAFKKFKVLFPGKKTPSVYYFNSGFNVGIWPDTSVLGIGLEWYLGPQNKIVKSLPGQMFPQYKRDNMQPAYMVPDAVKGWLLVNFIKREYAKDLLEFMVFNGKVMYALDAALPEVADSVKMNYTARQMKWCYDNERNIWKTLTEKELIYSTRERDIIRFTGDGPFTNGMPQESAPKAGIFIGWQMVTDYMNEHPDTPLEKLMNAVSAQEILKAYKPKR